mmetsp:Transcript_30918/g.52835  ORF Transcript_30918/g.52835 Transcript_30918/m.52835 type:complete len:331 (+) Transcript_30918:505-1497(+)
MLVLIGNKLLPGLFRMPSQNPIKVWIQFQIICVQVVEQLLGPQHLGNLHQLIVIIMPMEEGFLSKNHPGEHAPQAPHIQRVIVLLQIDQQFRSLEVPTRHAYVVLASGMVKFRQPPIDEPQLSLLVIDHDIVRLHVPVHDSIGMTVIERLEQFEDVIPNIVVREGGVQYLEIGIVDMLEDEGGSLGLRIPHHVEELNDVGAPAHILQYFDLALDLLLFDGFEDFDDAFGIVPDVDSLEYLGVFSAADFAYDLVIFLVAPVDGEGLVVPVVAGAMDIDVGVDSSTAHCITISCFITTIRSRANEASFGAAETYPRRQQMSSCRTEELGYCS